MRWRLSSSASRPHSKDARSTPTEIKQRENAPASNAVRLVTLLQIVPIMIVTRDKKRVGRRRKRRTTGRQRARRTLERNGSDCSSSDFDDQGLAASAFNKSSLFPNKRHTCLMAKEKKVCIRDTPKYTSSSDEESSDDEVDYTDLFKGLDRNKVNKINELNDALNEKDRLLEKQEDILYEEHDKFISVQKSLALEIKRNEVLSSELSACHESISTLKIVNDDLNAKIEEVSKISSCVEHVSICNRCNDFDVDACNEHLISITNLNDEVASLNAQFKTCKLDFDKLKLARDAYTIGRHPSIKDGLGFRKETKNLTSQKAPIFNKEKGKAPMASSLKRNHAFIYDRKLLVIPIIIRVMFILLTIIHMLCLPPALLLCMVEAGLGKIMLCIMCLEKCVINLLLFFMLATLLLYFHVRIKK
jgi:hypothetical protein